MDLIQKKLSKDDLRLDELLRCVFEGRYTDAISMGESYLKRKNYKAWEYVVGYAYVKSGDYQKASLMMRKLVVKSIKDPYCLYRLGHIAFEFDLFEDAVACFKRAVSLDKRFWEAFYNLGNTQKELLLYDEALNNYNKTLQLNPELVDAAFNAALLWEKMGRLEQAQDYYQAVLLKSPNDAEALCGVGRCMVQKGDFDTALRHWQRALELDSQCVEAYNNITNALISRGQFDQALELLQSAIDRGIAHYAVYYNIGRVLQQKNNSQDALSIFEVGLEKFSNIPELWSGYIQALINLNRNEEAESILNSLFAAGYHQWYLKASMAKIYIESARLDDAKSVLEELLSQNPNNPALISSYLACMVYSSSHTTEELFAAHQKYAARLEVPVGQRLPIREYSVSSGRKIRIGYVSPDFREHATSRFMEPIIANHDRDKFHISLYAESKIVDAVTKRFQEHADSWCFTTGTSDAQLAQMIRDDEIDILVDLAGHTPGNRLGAFAYRPAPVQASWMGYPFTTGMRSIDYYFADKEMVSEQQGQLYFTEQVIHIPFDERKKRPSKVNWLPGKVNFLEKLPFVSNGYFTFGCLNRLEKMSIHLREAWVEILRQVPDSRLLLMNRNFDEEAYRQKCIGWFAENGIDEHRLDFRPSTSLVDYLLTFNQIDLGLDTYPYNGSTVSYDSLRMGVPFVSLTGKSAQSRAGEGLLASVGLSDFSVQTYEEYVRLSVQLATSSDKLSAIRKNLVLHTQDPWNKVAMDWAVVPIEEIYIQISR
ncbi:tetratricopeptide repeat protein [Kiloniella laminariae]|uniref:tetratricopeptide repeat protein n=1 Tax=Kiloniella laminariae TaxID=454162 RepID=UPI000373A92A|nr:glycosyltransferase family 41 protein [Kiloniella laminariae]